MMMRVFCIPALILAFALTAFAADYSCLPLTIPAEIELPAGKLALADILPGSTCPAIRSAARQVHLGNVPLAGSPRVLTRDELRLALQKLDVENGLSAELLTIPERVTVRRKKEPESIAVTLARSALRSPKSRSLVVSTIPPTSETVRPGQAVTLVWDQGGIRVQVPAQCLDRGELGSEVRARILQSGVVVRAIVAGAGSLRAVS